MSEKYKFHDPDGIYFVTSTVINWIDLFTRPEFKHIVIDSLRYCQQNRGLVIHAWCIMPSHLHMIISSNKDPLAGIMRDFKKFTSKKIVEALKRINESRAEWMIGAFEQAAEGKARIKNFKVWQDGSQPKCLETNSFIDQKLDYIHDNPVKAEIVNEAEHYRYSSAVDYSGSVGLLKVTLLD